MSKVILLGAGASKSYAKSNTGVRMPVAMDFFETFRKLNTSTNPWVLIGSILNYIVKYRKISLENFEEFNDDIEILHSEIQAKLYDVLKGNKSIFADPNSLTYLKAYNELIYLFVSVINEIQNGSVSESHINLAKQIKPDDSIITFNWDTLMDRALNQNTSWSTDKGYFKSPKMIYRDKWVTPDSDSQKNDYPIILKLHGSSNWLSSHTFPEDGKLKLMQETPEDDFFVFESNIVPYSCHAGKYMEGYEDFSYGYYPPNLPLRGKEAPEGMVFIKARLKSPLIPEGKASSNGLVSMPLIIPPVQKKEYDQFGNLFNSLWEEAEKRLIEANEIFIIGYSFPRTDYRSSELFKSAFTKRKDMPRVIIINPSPESIEERFLYEFGITKNKLEVRKEYFNEKTQL